MNTRGCPLLAIRFCSRPRQRLRALHPAVPHFLLELLRPVSRNVLARQMHDRIAAGKFRRIQRLVWVPLHFALARRPSNQGNGLMTRRLQRASQRPSNQSRSTADEYTHKFLLCND